MKKTMQLAAILPFVFLIGWGIADIGWAVGDSVVERLAAENPPTAFTRLSDNRVARLMNSEDVEVVTTLTQIATKTDLLAQKKKLTDRLRVLDAEKKNTLANLTEVNQVLVLFVPPTPPIAPPPTGTVAVEPPQEHPNEPNTP